MWPKKQRNKNRTIYTDSCGVANFLSDDGRDDECSFVNGVWLSSMKDASSPRFDLMVNSFLTRIALREEAFEESLFELDKGFWFEPERLA